MQTRFQLREPSSSVLQKNMRFRDQERDLQESAASNLFLDMFVSKFMIKNYYQIRKEHVVSYKDTLAIQAI